MPPLTSTTPLAQALSQYAAKIKKTATSAHTAKAYQQAGQVFLTALQANEVAPTTPVGNFCQEWFAHFLEYMRTKVDGEPRYAETTEALYMTAMLKFVEDELYRVLDRGTLDDLRKEAKKRRKISVTFPPFERAAIDRIIRQARRETTQTPASVTPAAERRHRLIAWRDYALVAVLADTGLRVFEACALRRGNLDAQEGRATVVGKGKKEAQVRFSKRALRAVKTYLEVREDAETGDTLKRLPLFARHDRAAGTKTLPMTVRTAGRAIDRLVATTLGKDQVGQVTPHTFRHYFVTVVIRASGGDFQVAQKLARHANIATTQRYAHISDSELDEAYGEIFDKSGAG